MVVLQRWSQYLRHRVRLQSGAVCQDGGVWSRTDGQKQCFVYRIDIKVCALVHTNVISAELLLWSSTLIVCQSPAAFNPSKPRSLLPHEVLYRGEDASPSGRGPDEDEEPHADAFHFDYVEDPQFYTANKEKLIKHHPGEPLILIINVSVCVSII